MAGGAGASGEHRRDARRAPIDPHAHLLRRERLPAVGLPGVARETGGRHHHARYSKVRRLGGGEKNRGPGSYLLHSHCSTLPGLAHRNDGRVPCDGDGTQLPGSGMALGPSGGALGPMEAVRSGGRHHPEGPHHGAGPSRNRSDVKRRGFEKDGAVGERVVHGLNDMSRSEKSYPEMSFRTASAGRSHFAHGGPKGVAGELWPPRAWVDTVRSEGYSVEICQPL